MVPRDRLRERGPRRPFRSHVLPRCCAAWGKLIRNIYTPRRDPSRGAFFTRQQNAASLYESLINAALAQ